MQEQGPFPLASLQEWFDAGYFPKESNILARQGTDSEWVPVHDIAAITSDGFASNDEQEDNDLDGGAGGRVAVSSIFDAGRPGDLSDSLTSQQQSDEDDDEEDGLRLGLPAELRQLVADAADLSGADSALLSSQTRQFGESVKPLSSSEFGAMLHDRAVEAHQLSPMRHGRIDCLDGSDRPTSDGLDGGDTETQGSPPTTPERAYSPPGVATRLATSKPHATFNAGCFPPGRF